MAEEFALRQIFSPDYSVFLLVVSFRQCSIIFILLSSEGQAGESSEPSNKPLLLRISGRSARKSACTLFMFKSLMEPVILQTPNPTPRQVRSTAVCSKSLFSVIYLWRTAHGWEASFISWQTEGKLSLRPVISFAVWRETYVCSYKTSWMLSGHLRRLATKLATTPEELQR